MGFMVQKTQESLSSLLFEASADAMMILHQDYIIRSLNSAAARLLETTTESLLGETFPFAINQDQPTELEIPTAENITRRFELSSAELVWRGEAAQIVTLRDITEQQNKAQIHEQRQNSLTLCLSALADPAIATNALGQIDGLNQSALKLIDKSPQQVIGQPLARILKLINANTGAPITHTENALLAAASSQTESEQVLILEDSGGQPTLITVEILQSQTHGSLKNSLIILRNAATLNPTAEPQPDTNKNNSLSLLAAGIAHDFNNILSSIIGNISVARMALGPTHALKNNLLAAEEATLQAKSLTQQLLSFAKGGSPALETTTRLGELVEKCASVILQGSNIKCEIEKTPKLWAVDADSGQISQVLNNLIINADQAMPNGGILKIKVENRTIEQQQFPELKTGNYVCIEIQDQGTGIKETYLKHIFDPYFTTKRGGNGLGLASSFSIIQRHGGLITVESAIDKGTTFTIHLPKSKKTPEPKSTQPMEQEEKPIHRGQGRILVMDDMEAMMNVAGEILSILGYEVAFSTNGQEAIDAYKKAKEAGTPYDAVVFDLTVPGGMGGEEAAEILIKYDPKLIAIASSGYSNSGVMSNYKDSPFKTVVPKPYRIKEMSDALEQVLKK
ncbi:MAG: two-component system cell cycle sensor histidine kinase/response regulator CckA [Lentimonas sp.]|jgi:two-component system cell cycle sensor histidine kinase/response regulator CckA